MLASYQNGKSLYPDYDGFIVYNDGSSVAELLKEYARKMNNK
ncbi:hypothetical protein VTU32_03410 [Thermoanaerobacter sp. CM-CNRG TB177]|jgi:hypothetical protein|nr:hypothetical protein [Thermoanaerobacter sp. CM-CNRG TB177]